MLCNYTKKQTKKQQHNVVVIVTGTLNKCAIKLQLLTKMLVITKGLHPNISFMANVWTITSILFCIF